MENSIHLALVTSQFNADITEKLFEGAQRVAHETPGVTSQEFFVPGAIELPLIAQKLAKTGKFQAIVCLGAVIRGETTHYDYVCEQASAGCQRVALDTGIPVIFGVLTTENEQQAWDRVGGRHGHKGEDAIISALQMVTLCREIERII